MLFPKIRGFEPGFHPQTQPPCADKQKTGFGKLPGSTGRVGSSPITTSPHSRFKAFPIRMTINAWIRRGSSLGWWRHCRCGLRHAQPQRHMGGFCPKTTTFPEPTVTTCPGSSDLWQRAISGCSSRNVTAASRLRVSINHFLPSHTA